MYDALLIEDPFRHVSTRALFSPLADMLQFVTQAGRANSVILRDQAHAERRFRELTSAWNVESMFMSSVTDMTSLPSYQKIIQLGAPAVPLLLGELQREPNHWFVALTGITGEDPVPAAHRGNLEKMTEAWLRWGRQRGYRC